MWAISEMREYFGLFFAGKIYTWVRRNEIYIIYINIFINFLERHILKALWRFTILKINKKLQKTIKSLSKKKGLEAPFECV